MAKVHAINIGVGQIGHVGAIAAQRVPFIGTGLDGVVGGQTTVAWLDAFLEGWDKVLWRKNRN
jgi:hypothetical protein